MFEIGTHGEDELADRDGPPSDDEVPEHGAAEIEG
jgi:hypothetical protein